MNELKLIIQLKSNGESPEIIFTGAWTGQLYRTLPRLIKKAWITRKASFLREHLIDLHKKEKLEKVVSLKKEKEKLKEDLKKITGGN